MNANRDRANRPTRMTVADYMRQQAALEKLEAERRAFARRHAIKTIALGALVIAGVVFYFAKSFYLLSN